ncbi:Uncharacterised protein [Vibrio cholerae]|nr:Uncharacterised protein [Vibrio cholerae]
MKVTHTALQANQSDNRYTSAYLGYLHTRYAVHLSCQQTSRFDHWYWCNQSGKLAVVAHQSITSAIGCIGFRLE